MSMVRTVLGAAVEAFPAWEEHRVGGWRLRHDPTLPNRRVNSAWDLGDPGMPVEEAVRRAIDWYGARDRRPILLTSAGSPADDLVGGWEVHAPTEVMTAPLEGATGPHEPTDLRAWAEAWATVGRVPDARRRALVERLASLPHLAGVVVDGSEPVAVGLGVRSGSLVGIFNVATSPRARRLGHARAVTTSLMAWGREAGATDAYLQVEVGNEPALRLYRGIGFTALHRYHYRVG